MSVTADSSGLGARLGTGWQFPPAPPASPGALQWRSGPELVRQSILLILDTEPGERIMRPDFGCGLRRFLMEPNTPTTRAAIGRAVDAALRAWEPRISVSGVDVEPTDDASTVLVSVAYVLLRDQSAAILRVPFAVGVPNAGRS